ncbi:MAG TPA: hypothetical protein VF178_14745 [Gemmatimonadaceae bacterium]
MTGSERDLTPAPRRLLPRVCAAAIAVFGFAPIANWLSGGHDAPSYSGMLSEWVTGSAIVFGAALAGWIVVRRTGWWPNGLSDRAGMVAASRHRLVTLGLLLASFALYVAIAQGVLSGRPLLIDEIVQVMQARIFGEGQLTRPAAPYPEFFGAMHVIEHNGRVFGQFPLGGPLMLLPGVLVNAPWLIGPLFGAASVALYWRLTLRLASRPAVALGATLLFAFAPFTVFMAGSHMNHVTVLTWLLVAMMALKWLTDSERVRPGLALVCGLGLGVAASIRPVDAAAFALPAAVWMLARAWSDRARWREVLAAGVGVAVPVSAVLAFNAVTTGDPLLFGYELLWGKSHALGFHQAPWGVSHTPARGLELVNLNFLRLQMHLFETPLPSLVPVALALALTRGVRGFDRYLLWSAALLVVAYFAYWHDGYFLGPRFMYPLLPVLALWTARLPSIVRERWPGAPERDERGNLERRHGGLGTLLREHGGVDRAVLLAYGAAAVMALSISVPMRARQYAGGMTSMRHDYLAPAAAAGVENALILVRESWGSQLMARLWGLGVPRSETETLYRSVDACVLDQAVSALEASNTRGAAAFAALQPLMRDSARVVESTLSPDFTERVLPGTSYGPVCAQRLLEDRAGYTFLAPILARDPGTNVYARDLHARDTLLFAMYPERPVYVLRAASPAVGAPLVLYPFSADSARRAWALDFAPPEEIAER